MGGGSLGARLFVGGVVGGIALWFRFFCSSLLSAPALPMARETDPLVDLRS
jgi:hypothetical protein